MPILSVVLLGKDEEKPHGHGGHAPQADDKDEEGHELKDSSFHDMLIHPNFEDEGSVNIGRPSEKAKKNSCIKYFKEFDENILKPILIYKYSKKRKEKQYELFAAMQNRGQHIENIYAGERNEITEEDQKDGEGNIINMIRRNSTN